MVVFAAGFRYATPTDEPAVDHAADVDAVPTRRLKLSNTGAGSWIRIKRNETGT